MLLFPIYWYSSPYLLNQWFEHVLTNDFAFGRQYALKDKRFHLVLTAGGSEADYSKEGANGHGITDFILPVYATIKYIKARCISTSTIYCAYDTDASAADKIVEKIITHVNS